MKKKMDIVALGLGVSRGAFRIEDAASCASIWGRGDMSPCEALEKRGRMSGADRESIESDALDLLERHAGDEFACLFSLGLDEPAAFRIQSLVEDASESTSIDDEETMEGALEDTGCTLPSLEQTRCPGNAGQQLRQSHPDRYLILDELGRGGVGRVLGATDRDIGRSVAIKMMLPDGAAPARVERFLYEARTTARLTHPNIVPVYEIGVLSHSEGASPYFTMLKIVGRDLRRIIADIRSGDRETASRFSRQRLLGIFVSACDAVSFAHDNGVLHRDLKPGNIMIGEYGEVFVVDWGLALVKGAGEPPMDANPEKTDSGSPDVAGSPAYMSPEQADGNTADLDERSDVYSLGAILYQILSTVPPFHGFTVYNVLAKVIAGALEPPSIRLKSVQSNGEAPGLPSVARDLDEICMKAMSRDKARRFSSVRELGEAVRMHLEGEADKERNRERAKEKIAQGRALLESLRAGNARLQSLESEIRRTAASTATWLPAEGKAGLWKLEDDLEQARDSQALTFTRAARAFQAALEFDRDSPEARAALADMYWEGFLIEEQESGRDRLVYEELVREFGDGRYDSRLQGDGRLYIGARTFGCGCLRVPSEKPVSALSVRGLNPFTGEGAGDDKREAGAATALKAHGRACRTVPVEGADVWVFAMEARGRVMVPVFPGKAADLGRACEVPGILLDRCFENASPFRPERHSAGDRPAGSALHLGKTPIDLQRFPMGSYLAIVAGQGYEPVRVPFRVSRQSSQRLEAVLFRPDEIPEGFMQVGGGRFAMGGDRKNPYSAERRVVETDLFFLSRHPVTCAEYLDFLNSDPDRHGARAPRSAPNSGFYWPRDGRGSFVLPTREAMEGGGRLSGGSRLDMCRDWWCPDWPVLSVSGEDILAFAAWRSAADSRVYSLPGSLPWEKAARGMDGRPFPWGFHCDASFANYKDSHKDGISPSPVTGFPFDESPYGMRGMAGNARECCIDRHPQQTGFRLWRGGAWLVSEVLVRATGMGAFPLEIVNNYNGGRLAWYPVLPFEADGM